MLAEADEIPPELEYLWFIYSDLSDSRQLGMAGPGAIPETEIDAYQRNRGIRFIPWELDCLRALDRCFRSVMND